MLEDHLILANLRYLLIVIIIFGLYLLRKYFKGGVCHSNVKLIGKTVIVTGSDSGIGKETARDLCRRGAKVIMACENPNLASKVAKEISQNSCGSVVVYHLDLADLKQVRKCADDILANEDRIDILINNAGVWFDERKTTKDGFEMNIGINHLGHFLFTLLLIPKIKDSAPGCRIVNVASVGHEYVGLEDIHFDDIHCEKREFIGMNAYIESKMANVLFTKELSRRLEGTGISCYSLHPGYVITNILRYYEQKSWVIKYLFWNICYFIFKNPVDGCQTSIYCAVDESLSNESGKYYADCKEKPPNPIAHDKEIAKKLWNLSLKEVGLENNVL